MEEVRIYCSECGFLNTKPGVQNECKACLSQLSLEGTINKVDVILSRFRAWASSKKVKKTIDNDKEPDTILAAGGETHTTK